MRKAGIAYTNLRVEMARRNIGIMDIAKACGYNRDTLARKLSQKSHIYLSDAFVIQRKFFPELDIQYLFESDTRDSA